RIDECERVTDQYPARPAHLLRVIGVVAGDAHLVADQLGPSDTLPQCGVALESVEQELERATFALLEVVRPAHRAHAHHTRGQRNHPHPAMLEPEIGSTRLNSSHLGISYAVFCLKKKTNAKR